MWARHPVVAGGSVLFGIGIEMLGAPGRLPDVEFGCGVYSSGLCGFPIAPVERTREDWRLPEGGSTLPCEA